MVRMQGVVTVLAAAMAGLSATASAVVVSTNASIPERDGLFGTSVAVLDDMNNDAIPEIAAGAPGEVLGEGTVYIINGATGAVIRSLTSPGMEAGGAFGSAIARVPDANNDGDADLVVGAPGETDDGAAGAGKVYLFDPTNGDLIRTYTSSAPRENGGFGTFVSGIRDVNGDTRGDVIIGAPNENVAITVGEGEDEEEEIVTGAGVAYLISGNSNFVIAAYTAPEPVQDAGFGSGVAALPSATRANRDDVAVGARFAGGAGVVYRFDGANDELLYTVTNPSAGLDSRFGEAMAAIGDIAGDDTEDFVIGAPGQTVLSQENTGRVFLIDGEDGSLIRTLDSPNKIVNGLFGISVARAGDVNGDDVPDFMVGAPGEVARALPGSGRVHVFSGGMNAPSITTFNSIRPSRNGNFGTSVAFHPSVDAEGTDGLAVGAPREVVGSRATAGHAYVANFDDGGELPPPTSGGSGCNGEMAAGPLGTPSAGWGDGLVVVLGAAALVMRRKTAA